MIRAASLIFLCLTACASPQDRCLRNATVDLRTVNRLIAETEQSIARGYTYELEQSRVQVGIGFCTGSRGGFLFCGNNTQQIQKRPVAIDADSERRKLASLKTKRSELQEAASATVAACRTRYGSTPAL